MAATTGRFSPTIFSLSSSPLTKVEAFQPILYPYPPCPNSFKPNSAFKYNNTFQYPRLRISQRAALKPRYAFRVLAVSGLGNGDSETYPELGPSSHSSSSRVNSLSNDSPAQEATSVDLKLPRRSLMVHFTCDACGERTQRLISRLAYERGTVFVQCAGCLQHHKLVDNLGLVVEYDLREDLSMDANTDEV